MTDNDFRAAVDVEVTRWQFAELVRREFAPGGVSTRLAASPGAPVHEIAPAMTGQGDLDNDAR